MRMKRPAFGILLAAMVCAPSVFALSNVVTESVNNYSACCSGCNLSNSNAAANTFASYMVSAGFSVTGQYYDSNVNDTDFADPQLTGHTYDDDLWTHGYDV